MQRCRRCNRPIWHPRSECHGMGPVCWGRHLAEIRSGQREIEAFLGYTWARVGNDQYVVVTPEHMAYSCDLADSTCTCQAWTNNLHRLGLMECKHLVWLQAELAAVELVKQAQEEERERRRQEKAAKDERRRDKTSRFENVQAEIARDFA